MKKLLLLLCLLSASQVFSQVFYKGTHDEDFKGLIKNGVTYLPSGDRKIDSALITAFRENWKVTSFTVFNPIGMLNAGISNNEIVIINAYVGGERVLALISYKYIAKQEKSKKEKSISKYETIGYICLNGFNRSFDEASIIKFSQQAVKGLNDPIGIIIDNDISNSGAGLYKKLYEKTLPKAKILQTKTLLIIDDIKQYVDLKALERKGVKYKVISFEEYSDLKKEDLSTYCLMYFAYNSFTEISIYDLEKNDLIYTRHFANGKNSFSGSDISDIANLWN